MNVEGYKFTWKPIHTNQKLTYQTVYSYTREQMDRFLLQHGFEPTTANVEVVYDDEDIDDACLLHTHHFGSRNRDKIYDVETCEEIIIMVITEVADELASTMLLGACALRGEIEIFDKISKLLDQLDYTCINDPTTADTSGYDTCDTEEYINGYPYYESFAMNNDCNSTLYETLHAESFHGKSVQPITLESYVNIFTSIFLVGRG